MLVVHLFCRINLYLQHMCKCVLCQLFGVRGFHIQFPLATQHAKGSVTKRQWPGCPDHRKHQAGLWVCVPSCANCTLQQSYGSYGFFSLWVCVRVWVRVWVWVFLGHCVCLCACPCTCTNNIKKGDPHGSRAPVVAQGATKTSAAYSMCAILSGARQGHSRRPRLGQNLWWGGVM